MSAATENLFSNLLTIFILLTLGLIIYLKMTKKTFIDFIREIREITKTDEEVVQ